MTNDLPKGFALQVRESCYLGARNKVLSTHRTAAEAEKAAKSLNCSLGVLKIYDIYNDRTLTARV